MLLPWAVGSMALAQKDVSSCSSGQGGKAEAAVIGGEEERGKRKPYFITGVNQGLRLAPRCK